MSVKKLFCIALAVQAAAFADCVSTGSGFWYDGGNWSGCAGPGGIPASTDAVTVATVITLNPGADRATTVSSVTVDGDTAQLLVDGVSAQTLTLTATVSPLEILAGCNAVAGACTSIYALDTSAGSNGNELTIATPNVSSSASVVAPLNSPYNQQGINLSHTVIEPTSNSGAVSVYTMSPVAATGTKIVGGAGGWTIENASSVSLINQTWTGATGGNMFYWDGVSAISPCVIANAVMLDPAGNAGLSYAPSVGQACNWIGPAVSSDVAGDYMVTGLNGNGNPIPSAMTISYPLMESYYPTNGETYVVAGMAGTPLYHVTIENGAAENLQHMIGYSWYNDSVGNVCRQYAATGDQGCFFDDNGGAATSTNDACINLTNNGNICWFVLQTGSSLLVTNATCIMTTDLGNSTCYQFGESGYPSSSPSGMYDSVGAYGSNGIASGDTGNILGTAGTDGVGVSNNDIYDVTGSAYLQTSGDTNFQSGSTAHPNAVYGDLNNVNPQFYPEATTRSFARVDELIGSLSAGRGTAEHLFTMLGNQWNGTNGLYTPQLVYRLMAGPILAQNPALNTASRSGSYIGSAPASIFAAGSVQ